MTVTGVRYLIAENVAGGSVEFGHTNMLNGAQWAKAFTDALRTRSPQWWDPKDHGFRRDNLIFLTQNGQTVLVLPRELAAGYLRRGFFPAR
jgi:hypothetical protein